MYVGPVMNDELTFYDPKFVYSSPKFKFPAVETYSANGYEPSVFNLPRPTRCRTSEYGAHDYVYHQKYDACPVHGDEATVAKAAVAKTDHERWAKSRDTFIKSPDPVAQQIAYDLMLGYVTEYNPPWADDVLGEYHEAKVPVQPPKTPPYALLIATASLLCVLLIILVCVL